MVRKERMKVLYSKEGWVLGDYDINNYCIYKEAIIQEGDHAGEKRQTHMRYYTKMEDALISLCQSVSKQEAKSLQGWLDCLRSTVAHALESLSKSDVAD